ncbi:MAG: hypothetical protein AB8B55_12195 [Mariniblastus sp.]
MQYPLSMSFKILALAPQIKVTDATGETVCYVQQKMFRLKEAVTVFTDEKKQATLCEIKADKIIDWSACYHFYDNSGESFGAVRRKGMRSIWKAHYQVLDENNQHISTIEEENPMAKVMDSLLGEIPVLGMLTGYLFHPKYLLKSVDGQPRLRLTKEAAFLEGKYRIDKLVDYDPVDELRALMSFLMMSLLERARG